VNAMLTDDDLARLLTDAASTFDVPERAPLLGQLTAKQETRKLPGRRVTGIAAAASLLVAAALLMPGFGGGAVSSSKSSPAQGVVTPQFGGNAGGAADSNGTFSPLSAPVVGAPAGGALARSSAGGTSASAPQKQPSVAAGTTVAGAKAGPADGGDARVVKTGTVTLLADKGKVAQTVVALKSALAGARGYVASENSQPIGDNPTATVTVRVPAAAFEAVETQFQKLGAKVVSVTATGRDVTAAYADTAAQIASLRAARSRFLTILSRANTIGETLTVQQRVDDVQSQIDRLEGQRQVLANQSDLATLTVTVSEKAPAAVKVAEQSGISSAWDRAKHGFSSGFEGLVARSGRALLVLIVLAVGVVVGRVGWRLARRRLV
jgi:hypothetical protein